MFKQQTELEIKISGGRIVSADVINDSTCKLTIETKMVDVIPKDRFVLIEASKLRLDDRFMKYRPKTGEEKTFKSLLSGAIKSGLKDFYRPILDPSFNDDNSGICYEFGKKPAVGKSYNWWIKAAKRFDPFCHIGTRYEYVAFLGVLIKKLVESGWSISKAWNAVCTDSKNLGHYYNSENAKDAFENTGSREICGFYDLANTSKLLADETEFDIYWEAGGTYDSESELYPLYDTMMADVDGNHKFTHSVGWLVIDA